MYLDICETLETSFSIKGSKSSAGKSLVNHTAKKTYLAVMRKSFSFEQMQFGDITEGHVACDPRLPVVNRSTWYSSLTGLSMPFAVCTSKDVTRDSKNGNAFTVTCNFETGPIETEQCTAAPPANAGEIQPEVSIEVGSYERVLYADKDGEQCWKLPTGSPFQSPVTETIPTLRLTITQFETFVTFEEILERSFKTNSATYRSKDAGLWLIGAVKATEQDVTFADGSVNTLAKVTYPIMLSERFFYPPGVDATDANKTVYGHDHVQPLVDTYKLDAAGGDPEPITGDNGNVTTGYINTDGTLREPAAANEERPDYLRFRTQDEIDFSTFLQA
jgi:hypothetical protein